MKTLAVIPARGGSKGLPGKNIRPIAGKPLLAWSIEAAQRSARLDRVVVSTDDAKIAEVAREWKCEVMKRPPELASDEATTIAVLTDIAKKAPDAQTFVVLQPTSPVRDEGLIDECVEAFERGGYDDLATGYYCKFREFGTHNNARRQDYKGFFYDDGNVYVLTRELVLAGKWFGEKIGKHEIAKHQNFEIDDEVDFQVLEALLERRAKTHAR